MRIINLDDWPWGGRVLIVLAQNRANTLGHAVTSGAHVAWCLLTMQSVRAMVGDDERLKKLDRQVDIALMTMPKGGAKAAQFSTVIQGLLEGGGARTTLNILRSSMMGVPGMGKADLELAAHAEAIAALLDHPTLEASFKEPLSDATARTLPLLTLGFALATKLGQRDLTTRHLAAASAAMLDKMLVKHAEPPITETVAQLEALLDGPRREGNVIQLTSRVIGAVAGALATPQPAATLLAECLRGDPAVAFAAPILDDARVRVRAVKAAAPKTT